MQNDRSLTFKLPAPTSHKLVEDVKAPFGLAPDDHPTLLEQIPINVCTRDTAIWREADTNELSETTGIVVALRLRVTKRLEDGVRLEDLPLKETQTAFGGKAET